MPTALRGWCLVVGCGGRAVYGGRCKEHAQQRTRQRNAARPTPAEQGYDAAWRKRRAAFLAVNDVCEMCGDDATEAHHVERLRDGGTHEDSNLQALCKRCHSSVTMREDTRKGR